MRGKIPKWNGRPAQSIVHATVYTANSGTIASGAESGDIVVAHTLGVVPNETIVGLPQDGSWAHQFGIRKGSTWSSTQVSFRFKNNGPNSGTCVLKYQLVT